MKTGSFARDWQFVKISRSWKPHDFSGEILDVLIREGDKGINERIKAAVFSIGRREGEEIMKQMGDRMGAVTVLEGILIISGQDYSRTEEEGKICFDIRKKGKGDRPSNDPELITIPYFRGIVDSVVPGSQFLDEDYSVRIIITNNEA